MLPRRCQRVPVEQKLFHIVAFLIHCDITRVVFSIMFIYGFTWIIDRIENLRWTYRPHRDEFRHQSMRV
jgi:hypothetical protein